MSPTTSSTSSTEQASCVANHAEIAELASVFKEYEMLLEQKKRLEIKISAAREKGILDLTAKIKEILLKYGIEPFDVSPAPRAELAIKTRRKPKPKFMNPTTGQTWTGRGVAPRWFVADEAHRFSIDQGDPE